MATINWLDFYKPCVCCFTVYSSKIWKIDFYMVYLHNIVILQRNVTYIKKRTNNSWYLQFIIYLSQCRKKYKLWKYCWIYSSNVNDLSFEINRTPNEYSKCIISVKTSLVIPLKTLYIFYYINTYYLLLSFANRFYLYKYTYI